MLVFKQASRSTVERRIPINIALAESMQHARRSKDFYGTVAKAKGWGKDIIEGH